MDPNNNATASPLRQRVFIPSDHPLAHHKKNNFQRPNGNAHQSFQHSKKKRKGRRGSTAPNFHRSKSKYKGTRHIGQDLKSKAPTKLTLSSFVPHLPNGTSESINANESKGPVGTTTRTIRLSLKCNDRKENEEVFIVGSLPSLGKWDESNGLKLKEREEHQYFIDIRAALGSVVEYKFFLKDIETGDIRSGPKKRKVIEDEAPQLQEERDQLLERVRELENDIKQLAEKNAELSISYESSRDKSNENELLALRSKSDSLDHDLANAQEKIRNLQVQLDESHQVFLEQGKESSASIKKLRKELQLHQDEISKLRENEKELVEERTALELKVKNLTIDSTGAYEKFDDLQSEFQDKEEELVKRKARIEILEKEILDISQALEIEERQHKQTKDCMRQVEKHLVALEFKVEESNAKYFGIEETFKQFRREHDEKVSLLTEKLSNSKTEEATLKSELSSLRSENEQLLDSLNMYKINSIQHGDTVAQLENKIMDMKGNIRVFARVRPANVNVSSKRSQDNQRIVTIPVENTLSIDNGPEKSPHVYQFDRVFGEESTQEEIYIEVEQLIKSSLEGYDIAIMAYGQTGTGKTYTMEGTSDHPGVNIRSLRTLFSKIQERERLQGDTFQVELSMMEIYNEQCRDLLSGVVESGTAESDPDSKSEHAKTDKSGHLAVVDIVQSSSGPVVKNLTKIQVKNEAQVVEVMLQGKEHRAVASTKMNQESSRSHLIVSIHLKGIRGVSGNQIESTLWLVDLAGSERLSRTGAKGAQLKEAKAINSSLSSLGTVMNALQQKSKHVPYRNSKLTHLLSRAFGATKSRARCLLICNVAPLKVDSGETLSSLKFAQRVGKIELGQIEKNETLKKFLDLKSSSKNYGKQIAALKAGGRGKEKELVHKLEKAKKEIESLRQQLIVAQREKTHSFRSPGPVSSAVKVRSVKSSVKMTRKRKSDDIAENEVNELRRSVSAPAVSSTKKMKKKKKKQKVCVSRPQTRSITRLQTRSKPSTMTRSATNTRIAVAARTSRSKVTRVTNKRKASPKVANKRKVSSRTFLRRGEGERRRSLLEEQKKTVPRSTKKPARPSKIPRSTRKS